MGKTPGDARTLAELDEEIADLKAWLHHGGLAPRDHRRTADRLAGLEYQRHCRLVSLRADVRRAQGLSPWTAEVWP